MSLDGTVLVCNLRFINETGADYVKIQILIDTRQHMVGILQKVENLVILNLTKVMAMIVL